MEPNMQKELVAKIYSVHERLRKERKQSVDFEQVWSKHKKDKQTLKEYAEAMKQLAVHVWEPRNTGNNVEHQRIKCRLDWVHERCKEYFLKEKEEEEGKKLKMLDAGSCYNPFQKFDEFYDITALDLCPAVPGVYQCDFLTLRIGDAVECNLDEPQVLISLKNQSFDIVVFSFMLEYLPDKRQRLESCRKAWDLLREGGILFILRPDSKSASSTLNSKLMKALKVGMAWIGYYRLYFEKLAHLWCCGFVKMDASGKQQQYPYFNTSRFQKDLEMVKKSLGFSEERMEDFFQIPQDLKEFSDDGCTEAAACEGCDIQMFAEVPGFVTSDDDQW